jgi:hypothetical protein
MSPSQLPDEALTMIHDGAGPIYFRDRPTYYHIIADTISAWRESTPAMNKAAVKDAQRKITRGAPADAE